MHSRAKTPRPSIAYRGAREFCVSTDTIEVTIAKPADGHLWASHHPARGTLDIQRIELGRLTPILGLIDRT